MAVAKPPFKPAADLDRSGIAVRAVALFSACLPCVGRLKARRITEWVSGGEAPAGGRWCCCNNDGAATRLCGGWEGGFCFRESCSCCAKSGRRVHTTSKTRAEIEKKRFARRTNPGREHDGAHASAEDRGRGRAEGQRLAGIQVCALYGCLRRHSLRKTAAEGTSSSTTRLNAAPFAFDRRPFSRKTLRRILSVSCSLSLQVAFARRAV